jgi:hypothetical protein
VGLDRSDVPFFERNERVKGGFAAAQRFTLDALIAFKHDNPSDQGRGRCVGACVSYVSERVSVMSPGCTLVPAIHVLIAAKDVDARDKRGHDDGST